jgi:hypothetical protein
MSQYGNKIAPVPSANTPTIPLFQYSSIPYISEAISYHQNVHQTDESQEPQSIFLFALI